MLIHPAIDPVAIHLGPLAVRWYGLAYVAALLGGLWGVKKLAERYPAKGFKAAMVDDLFIWIVVGVIAGGRLGFILFYDLARYIAEPSAILRVWEGGMSFHGGMLGVVLAMLLFAWKHRIHPVDIADRVVVWVPLGLLLGRIANFVNGELWGRVTSPDLPWAMMFPHVDSLPRHPSQLYEAGLEGVVLGGLLALLIWFRKGFVRGESSGVFLLGYGLARFWVENFRTPEIVHNLGWIAVTQGQVLSLPMVVVGLAMMVWAGRGRA
jgi:phosphatidylglycerol:prolipoprotein diacylglycerol transferase